MPDDFYFFCFHTTTLEALNIGFGLFLLFNYRIFGVKQVFGLVNKLEPLLLFSCSKDSMSKAIDKYYKYLN